MSNLNTVVKDVSVEYEDRFQLYVDDQPRVLLTRHRSRGGRPQFHWQVYGPQLWPEAKALISGLLQLTILADRLSHEDI